MQPPVDFLVDRLYQVPRRDPHDPRRHYELGFAPPKNTRRFSAQHGYPLPGFWETAARPASTFSPIPQVSRAFQDQDLGQVHKAFKAKLNREPDAVAMEGYDTVMVLARGDHGEQVHGRQSPRRRPWKTR